MEKSAYETRIEELRAKTLKENIYAGQEEIINAVFDIEIDRIDFCDGPFYIEEFVESYPGSVGAYMYENNCQCPRPNLGEI